MTKQEMLLNMLAKSGWTVTSQTDEDGYKIAVAADKTNEGEN
jgi:hypothetical protein